MKILQVCPFFPKSPKSTASGVVRVVYYLSTELIKRGHDVTICTSTSIGYPLWKQIHETTHAEMIDGIKVRRFPFSLYYYTFFVTPQIATYLRHNIGDFNIIHLHDVRCFQTLVTHYYANKHQIPYVLQPHGSYLGTLAGGKLTWVLDVTHGRSVVSQSRRVLALNSTEAKFYTTFGIPAERVEIVGNGIDTKEYIGATKGRFRKKFGIGHDERIVLYVGRIAPSKGLDILIDAFSIIKEQVPVARLVLVGPDDGGYSRKLEKQAKDLKLENYVLFAGHVEDSDKINSYADAAVFVTPRFTGFPLTFLEACVCGTPIITTREGDLIEWIDNNVGYVTEYSKDALARATIDVITRDHIRERFANNCTAIAARFAWSTIARDVEGIYERVIKSFRPTTHTKSLNQLTQQIAPKRG